MGWPHCVLLASAPGLFWLWLFWRRDRWEREPLSVVVRLFLAGAAMAVPAYFAEGWLPNFGSRLFDNFVRVGLVEEACKLLPVWWLAYRHREFDEPMDGIVYAVAAALGFATVENALYALLLGPHVVLVRAFTSTLAHVAFSGLVGFQLGRAKFRGRGRAGLVLGALLASTLLHGAYDLALSYGSDPRLGPAVATRTVATLLPALLVLLWWAGRRADRASPFRPADEA
jgi:RsiW-degrading membrane proteinase PrsW (M82 family)